MERKRKRVWEGIQGQLYELRMELCKSKYFESGGDGSEG